MTNIPFNAIGAALSPVQRSNNELVHARRVQSDKNSHHTEDVEELDETAVNAVDDQQQRGGGREKNRDPRHSHDEPEERVEIASLPDVSGKPVSRTPSKPAEPPPSLDISA
jgi:hypothetical protein